ncbi:MAG: imidazoleglycerol-phosphate dehydratase HisB [Planctomycetota bacterium]
MSRTAGVRRETAETKITLDIDLDGSGRSTVTTGVGFLDHMLTLFAKHGLFDLTVEATGDTQVDDHHTTEDVGIALGKAFGDALGDKSGIVRYGSLSLPMDEALVTAAVDLSGRPALGYAVTFPSEKIGTFDTELVREFWNAVATNLPANLHFVLHHGENSHHIAEAMFKAAARSLRTAVAIDPRQQGVPSSKGSL